MAENQQRPLAHRLGRRRILQELHHLVLVDDLARRRREILPDVEMFQIGHLHIEAALVAIQVLHHVRDALKRFSPLLSIVAFSTSGLVAAKLVGDIASMNWRV